MTPTHTVDMRAFQERKVKAFECHRTQFKDRDRFLQMVERREGKEFFHLAIDRGATPPDPGDILA
jgi:LmbE family N-acetylglucosaminyl deacetylase